MGAGPPLQGAEPELDLASVRRGAHPVLAAIGVERRVGVGVDEKEAREPGVAEQRHRLGLGGPAQDRDVDRSVDVDRSGRGV
jgi:hypothetical protein